MNFKENFGNEFPVCESHTYLNTAANGLLPRSVMNWRREHDEEFLNGGSIFREGHKTFIWEIKETVARFFHTEKDRIALVPNFSIGINMLMEGISKGQRVLMIEGDYPSVNWPVEYRDFDVCYAALNADLEKNIEKAFEKYKPNIFLCSIVQYISGLRIDLDFLKKLKESYPNTLFIGDGTQFFGTADFNFQESAFDIVGASAYKWLLAGFGNGFFLLKEGVEEDIFPKAIGFNSADAVFGKKDQINMVGRMEPGHQDTLNYGSLKKALEFLDRVGIQNIEAYLTQQSKFICERLTEHELLEPTIIERKQHGTIFNIKGNKAQFRKLHDANIICSQRGKGIRVSFHLYNGISDLEKLLEIISPF